MKNIYTFSVSMILFMGLTFAQPANDLCADAIDISELFAGEIGVGTVLGPYSNVDATGEPELSSNLVDLWFDVAAGQTEPSIDQSVWFKFTGDGGVYQMATGNWCPGAAMYANDTQAALYSGTCDSLSLITANDDIMYQWDSNLGWWYSIFNFEAMEGIDYWIMVDGYNHYQGNTFQGISAGSFCLHAVGVEPMTEHTICDGARNINEIFDATTVSSPGFVGPFDDSEVGSGIGMNPNADMLGTECWEDATDDGSVWFSFTGDGNSYTITHSQCGLDPDYNAYYFGYDSQMALYKGDCGELVPIDCSEDINPDEGFWWSQVGLDSEDGTEYFLRFDGFHWDIGSYDWSAEGSFCLRSDFGNINEVSDVVLPFVIDAYPNPSEGSVTFSWSGNDNNADVYIVDMTGKTVSVLSQVARNQQSNLNLPAGHYIVQIITSETAGTSRLQIIQ